jgi:hypothetical protein
MLKIILLVTGLIFMGCYGGGSGYSPAYAPTYQPKQAPSLGTGVKVNDDLIIFPGYGKEKTVICYPTGDLVICN